MRSLIVSLVSILICATATEAAAEAPVFQLSEDTALGTTLDKPVLGDHVAAMASCAALATPDDKREPSSGAIYYLELDRAGRIVAAKVRGTGKPALDTCLESALRAAKPARKLTAPVALAGRIEVTAGEAKLPAARLSTTPVLLPPHGAKWQLSVHQLGYTANRAEDLAKALDATSSAIAACAPRRGAKAEPAEALVWHDGKVIVRSGAPGYDGCVAKALEAVVLPTPASAAWMKIAILPPAEPLAPRTDKPSLSHDRALADALSTAVRSRKELLLACVDGVPNAALAKVTVSLAGGKARLTRIGSGDRGADACIRSKFGEVSIPSAKPEDRRDLEVALD